MGDQLYECVIYAPCIRDRASFCCYQGFMWWVTWLHVVLIPVMFPGSLELFKSRPLGEQWVESGSYHSPCHLTWTLQDASCCCIFLVVLFKHWWLVSQNAKKLVMWTVRTDSSPSDLCWQQDTELQELILILNTAHGHIAHGNRKVSEMLDMNSTFTQLITREDFGMEASSTEFGGCVLGRKGIQQNAQCSIRLSGPLFWQMSDGCVCI
jgi:hypothetical protein